MAQHGKRYVEAVAKLEEGREYEPREAVRLARETNTAKFDATVESHLRLGVDPRHADQMVRGSVVLPHGTGKTVRLLVFAQGEKAKEALDNGADFVGGEDMVKKIQGGWMEFDATIATPDLMGLVGQLGKVLGPRGLMPNPKAGTVTFDVAKGIKDVRAGRVEFRVDRYGIIHAPIGKASFSEEQLADNFAALVDAIVRARPQSSKGTYLKSVTLATTMGPAVPVDPREAAKLRVA
ncbi:MAG: 50S ribosomal protein L1 [Candidatus Dormibacteria bacterium]